MITKKKKTHTHTSFFGKVDTKMHNMFYQLNLILLLFFPKGFYLKNFLMKGFTDLTWTIISQFTIIMNKRK